MPPEEPAPVEQRRRVFFAVWPSAPALRQLDRAAQLALRACGGRRMFTDTLHLTLAFVGEVDGAQLRMLEAIGDELRGETFELQLDRLGYWRHKRIVWAGCSMEPAPLLHLAGDLAEALRRHGFATDARPFATHVTLLRNARRAPHDPLPAPIRWQVDEMALNVSELCSDGARYTAVRRWPLIGR